MTKYVSLDRLADAIQAMQSGYPSALISFLAMKHAGVNQDNYTVFGSTNENELLDRYFRPHSGAPSGKRYFVPFSRNGWVDNRYAGSTLQRGRTSRNPNGNVFANGLLREGDGFRFSSDVLDHLTRKFPHDETGAIRRLNIFDFVAWMNREASMNNKTTLPSLAANFRDEFKLSREEFDVLFAEPSDEDEIAFFSDSPIDADDLIRLLGGTLSVLDIGDREPELVAFLEKFFFEQNFLLPAKFILRFYTALKSQSFVILVGKPGTGKTEFIQLFVKGLSSFFQTNLVTEVFNAVSATFTETDLLGYENLEGEHRSTKFVDTVFDSQAAIDGSGIFFAVFDEFNMAHADHYLAKILPAIENDMRVALPAREAKFLPPDTFFVATANSYLDEPSRLPISGPVLRRAQVISMPNALSQIVSNGGDSETRENFRKAIKQLCEQTGNRIRDRAATRGESVFDEARTSAINMRLDADSTIEEKDELLLLKICQALDIEDASSLTFGVLQDAVDYMVLSAPDANSLDEALSQKILPQLRGPIAMLENVAQLLEESGRDFPESIRYCQTLKSRADHVSGLIQPLF